MPRRATENHLVWLVSLKLPVLGTSFHRGLAAVFIVVVVVVVVVVGPADLGVAADAVVVVEAVSYHCFRDR